MVRPSNPTRRTILVASMLSSAATAVSAASTGGQKALVAYFSRSGNTQVIAGVISRSVGADLFEIEPARPYPADYFETVEQARQERDRGDEPALKRARTRHRRLSNDLSLFSDLGRNRAAGDPVLPQGP
jgi:hypothetical protein